MVENSTNLRAYSTRAAGNSARPAGISSDAVQNSRCVAENDAKTSLVSTHDCNEFTHYVYHDHAGVCSGYSAGCKPARRRSTVTTPGLGRCAASLAAAQEAPAAAKEPGRLAAAKAPTARRGRVTK